VGSARSRGDPELGAVRLFPVASVESGGSQPPPENSLAKEVNGQKEKYAHAIDSMRDDAEFLGYLESHAATASDEGAAGR